MTLLDIVGRVPQPWWPEGLSHNLHSLDLPLVLPWVLRPDDLHEEYLSDSTARLLFEASCLRWLCKNVTDIVSVDDDGETCSVQTSKNYRNINIWDAPDMLSALHSACIEAQRS